MPKLRFGRSKLADVNRSLTDPSNSESSAFAYDLRPHTPVERTKGIHPVFRAISPTPLENKTEFGVRMRACYGVPYS